MAQLPAVPRSRCLLTPQARPGSGPVPGEAGSPHSDRLNASAPSPCASGLGGSLNWSRASSPSVLHRGSRGVTPTLLYSKMVRRRTTGNGRTDSSDSSAFIDLAHDDAFQRLRRTLQNMDNGSGRLQPSQLAELKGRLGPFHLSQEAFADLQKSLDIVLLPLTTEGVTFERVAQHFYPRVSWDGICQQFMQWPARHQIQELYSQFCSLAEMGANGMLRLSAPPVDGRMLGRYFLSSDSFWATIRADTRDNAFPEYTVTFEQLLRALFPSMQRAAACCLAKAGLDFWEYVELRKMFDAEDADRGPRFQMDAYDFLRLPSHRGVYWNLHIFLQADTEKTGRLSFNQLLAALFPLIPPWYLAYATRHWKHPGDLEFCHSSTLDIAPTRPAHDADELKETDMLYLFDAFDTLDTDRLGELSELPLVGKVVAGLTITPLLFRRMDTDRSGTVTFYKLLRRLFPRLSWLNLARLCQTSITAKELKLLREEFRRISTKGVLSLSNLHSFPSFIHGVDLQRLDFHNACGGGPVRFPDFLQVLFPAVDPKEIYRVTCTEIPEREYFRLKYAFEALDTKKVGFLTVEEFNRSRPGACNSYADTLRQQQDETSGGMKFDVKAFNVLDADGSGTVTFEEYVRGWYPSLWSSTLKQMVAKWGPPHQQGPVLPSEATVAALQALDKYATWAEVHLREVQGRQKWPAALRQVLRQTVAIEVANRAALHREEAAAWRALAEAIEVTTRATLRREEVAAWLALVEGFALQAVRAAGTMHDPMGRPPGRASRRRSTPRP